MSPQKERSNCGHLIHTFGSEPTFSLHCSAADTCHKTYLCQSPSLPPWPAPPLCLCTHKHQPPWPQESVRVGSGNGNVEPHDTRDILQCKDVDFTPTARILRVVRVVHTRKHASMHAPRSRTHACEWISIPWTAFFPCSLILHPSSRFSPHSLHSCHSPLLSPSLTLFSLLGRHTDSP